MTASETGSTGSTVDTIDAVGAPTRSIPSRNVLMASTVETSAIARIHNQPVAFGVARAPLTNPVISSVVAAPVVTSALNSQASILAMTSSETST